jgi:hypothetical protein
MAICRVHFNVQAIGGDLQAVLNSLATSRDLAVRVAEIVHHRESLW